MFFFFFFTGWVTLFCLFIRTSFESGNKSDYLAQIINKYHNNLIYFRSRFTHIDTVVDIFLTFYYHQLIKIIVELLGSHLLQKRIKRHVHVSTESPLFKVIDLLRDSFILGKRISPLQEFNQPKFWIIMC